MNCFDCAAPGRFTPAVAVCADHAHVSDHWLTRVMAVNRPVRVGPPGRTIRCTVCQSAHDVAADATYASTG